MTATDDVKEVLCLLIGKASAKIVRNSTLPEAFDIVERRIRRGDKRKRKGSLAKLSEVKAKWNNELPIHQLPTEVLLSIFLQVNDASQLYSTMERNWHLAKICRRWHHTVIASPPLWSRISSEDSTAAIGLILQRSGNGKLMIDCDFSRHVEETLEEQSAFFEQTLGIASRVGKLDFYGTLRSNQSRYVKSISRYATTIHLSQSTSGRRGWGETVRGRVAILDQSPLVEHLILAIGRIEWSATRFRNLRTLVLHEVSPLPSTSQLHSVISACMELELIAFIRCNEEGGSHFSSSDESEADGDPPPLTLNDMRDPIPLVELPQLKWLIFSRSPERIINFFLQHVTTTECHYFHADALQAEDFSAWGSPPLKQLVAGPLMASIIHDVKVTISEVDRPLTIESVPSHTLDVFRSFSLELLHQYSGLLLEIDVDLKAQVMIEIVDFLMTLPCKVSNLCLKDTNRKCYWSDDWRKDLPPQMDVLSRMTSITHLTFGGEYPFIPVLEYIADRQTGVGVPFPRLKGLIFPFDGGGHGGEIGPGTLECILQPIKKRNELARQPGSGISPITELHTMPWIIRTFEQEPGFKQEGVAFVKIPWPREGH